MTEMQEIAANFKRSCQISLIQGILEGMKFNLTLLDPHMKEYLILETVHHNILRGLNDAIEELEKFKRL